jgi:predicted transcriptional regulator
MTKARDLDMLEVAAKAYARMAGIIANENRLKILILLERGPRTWTQLMFEVKVNPKVLRHHLIILRRYGLVEKKRVGFAITNAGKALVKMSLDSIISKLSLAQQIVSSNKRSG